MPGGITQLKKLRNRSFREVHERGRQELSKLGERLLGSAAGEMGDRSFLREVRPEARNGSGEGTAGLIARRLREACSPSGSGRAMLPSLARRDEVAALMAERFPEERAALVARAERAAAGSFDLLGFEGLGFGDPIDWHLEPVSGKRAPLAHWSTIDYLNGDLVGDKKVTWELNRHAHFVTLGQAYWLTGDERFAEAFVSQASAWMDANPPGRGINWASSLELAFRSVAWVWALHLFADSPRLTAPFTARLLKFLVAHGRHVESYLSHYFSPNTHLTGEALGLVYLGLALPELRRAAGWRERGLRILLGQLPLQVRPDGVYFEQTTYYHRYTADFYVHLVALARANGIHLPPEAEGRLALVLDHLMWTARPDGTWPLVGDDDGGRLLRLGERGPCDFRDTLATGAALFGRGDWKHVSGGAAAEALWLLGPDGLARYDAVEAAEPAGRARAFPDGGYYVMRDGWSAGGAYALVDCGPHGSLACGHAHADALALEFAAAGRPWLVDPGTFTYTGDPGARDAFRTTAAHNTATVDGEPQSVPGGPFSWRRVASASARAFVAGAGLDYFEGSHDGYERLADPVTHVRGVLFVAPGPGGAPAYLVVRDAFRARGRHSYAVRYHLAAGVAAGAGGGEVLATAPGGDRLALRALGDAARAVVEPGWVSDCYGRRAEAPVVAFGAEAEGPLQLVTLVAPQPTAPQPAAQGWRLEGAGPNALTLASGDLLDVVIAGPDGARPGGPPLAASAALAWGRFAGGRPVALCLAGGRSVGVSGGPAISSPSDVTFCSVELAPGRVIVSISGAPRFELALAEPAGEVVVNGEPVAIAPKRRFIFAEKGPGWVSVDGGQDV
jgi:uncharacterized heparinase superfamily protein